MPNKVSTRASWGFSTLSPGRRIQPRLSTMMPAVRHVIFRGVAAWFRLMPLRTTAAVAMTYIRITDSRTAMPFFLLFNTFSLINRTSLSCRS